MKHELTLTITSLISIALAIVHISDDVVRGFDPDGFTNVRAILIMVVWLYGTLVLSEGRLKYVIMLLGSLLGSVMPLAHMRGAGMVGGRIVGSDGIHFWVWTMLTLGVVAFFSVILSAQGLWSVRRGKAQ